MSLRKRRPRLSRRPSLLVLLLLGLGALLGAAGLDANAQDPVGARAGGLQARWSRDTVLVAFKANAPLAARLRAAGRLSLAAVPQAASTHFATLRIDPAAQAAGATVENTLAALRRDPTVRYAEPNYIRRATLLPNDPRFNELYGLNNTGQLGGAAGADIGAAAAWDTTTGSSSVIVAVIDTGVDYTHEDLTSNILRDGSGTVVGYDYANNSPDPMDDHSHGTHVAGTIGARGNNGIGVVGVNWNVKIMPLKFLDATGSGSDSDAALAIDFAVAHGANVINASWGGSDAGQTLLEAIQRARDAGVIFCAAAGNDGANNDTTPFYPASFNQQSSNVVAVAATNRQDALASFSNYGASTVDIAAPGVAILSTTPAAIVGSAYSSFSGTSMATPHVSGAFALVRAAFPNLSLADWKARILTNVDHPAAIAGLVATGRLDVGKAIGTASAPPPDTWEADDTPSQARAVSSGQVGAHTFHVAGDVDWVKFTVAAGAAGTMLTSGLAGTTDTVLELYDTNGTTLLKSDDNSGGGKASRITYTFTRAGTYFLKVREFGGRGGNGYAYNLTVTWSNPAPKPDAWEVDNTPTQARMVLSGQVGAHTFHVAGDVDWVKFTVLRAGATATITTSALLGSTDTVLDLYSTNGATLLRSDDNGGGGKASRISYTFSRAGTYFVRVREAAGRGGAGYGYSLTVRW
jgi:subtilisin family serine protease